MADAKSPPQTQKEARPYAGPYGPTPLSHVGFRDSRHLHPERVPFKKDKVTSIRLLDVSQETTTAVQNSGQTLKRMIASNLQLKTVPRDLLANLFYLTKLDLSHNQLEDTSFPDSMKVLEQLLEIRLSNNNLSKIPTCIRKMKHLKRLDLSDNQIETCIGLEKLRQLQILVLDNNKITSLFKEITTLKKLAILHCKRNHVNQIPRDVRELIALVDLDVSDNHISTISPDVFLLPKLDVLNASQNEITKVPTFNIRPQSQRWISNIDLSDNQLDMFPGHLLQMSSKLDLSGNKIRSLPYHVIRKLDQSKERELLLEGNPLSYPPPEVCESGLTRILAFFQDNQSDIKVYQGVKVLVLGSHRSGKTSFVQTLIDQQTRISEDVQDNAGGIDTYELIFDLEEAGTLEGRPGKSLELSIWDFCGHPFYLYPHYLFFEQPSISILTFNMAEYCNDDNFQEQIGSWFDWMIAKTNRIAVILVGTQCDRLTKSQIVKVSRDVRARLAEHIGKQTEMTRSRIQAIEDRPQISPTLSEQLKTYMKLLQAKFTVQTEVISTSAKNFTGFDRVRQAIETLAGDRQLYPNVMRVIPTFWLDVQRYIEDRGNAMCIPILKWDEFVEEVTSRFGMKHLMKSIAQYLHDMGQVMWFSNIAALKELVVLRPTWFFDVLRSVFRHDLQNATLTLDDRLKSNGLSALKFERLKQEILTEGVLDRDFLQYVLAPLIRTDLVAAATEIIRMLAEYFELGYPITKRPKDPVYHLYPSKDAEGNRKFTKILIPWLRRNSEPVGFIEMWEHMENNHKIVCCFKFPHYLPPGLFEIISVRAQKDKHKLHFLQHWKGGLHATHAEEKVHVLVKYYRNQHNPNSDKSFMLKYEIRDDSSDADKQTTAATLWSILLPLLTDFEELLTSYAGILVERLTECPLCREPSFLGEWLTPKETQHLTTRPCQACGQEVDTAFLVQPRERKRDDIVKEVMRRSRSRLGPASTSETETVFPEMNEQEGLYENVNINIDAKTEHFDELEKADSSWSSRRKRVDFNIEHVKLHQETGKLSSQTTDEVSGITHPVGTGGTGKPLSQTTNEASGVICSIGAGDTGKLSSQTTHAESRITSSVGAGDTGKLSSQTTHAESRITSSVGAGEFFVTHTEQNDSDTGET